MAIQHSEPIARGAPGASVIANLIQAQSALSRDPDLAALYLDGALRDLVALASDQAHRDASSSVHPLLALDYQRPDIARRLRLALRAPHAQARLSHCWALIELINADAALVSVPRES